MTFSPIVARELRVAARRPATYRNRVIVSGAVGALAISILMYGSMATMPSRIGSTLFQTMTWIALVFCLLDGVRKTADSLSEEKRSGTLGLLFLTDLKGYDVVFGKFTALSLGSIYGLLSLLPVLAISLLLGGVTMGEFWRLVLALACVQFFSLSAGIAVSASSRLQSRAVIGTVLLIALIAGLPWLGGTFWNTVSPLDAFVKGFDSAYVSNSAFYWGSLVYAQLFSWFFSVLGLGHRAAQMARPPRATGSRRWKPGCNRWCTAGNSEAPAAANGRARQCSRKIPFSGWPAGISRASGCFGWWADLAARWPRCF